MKTEIEMPGRTASETVADQLAAYNARSIESFMQYWHSDAEMLRFPDICLARGHEQIRTLHSERFKEPNLFARLISRPSLGNLVVDHEMVTRNFGEGIGKVEVVAIYQVENSQIVKAWFKPGEQIIDAAKNNQRA